MDQSKVRPSGNTRPDSFVSDELEMLHNWNNQLGVIMGQCLLLAQDVKDHPRVLERLETIQRTVRSLGDEVAKRQKGLLTSCDQEPETT